MPIRRAAAAPSTPSSDASSTSRLRHPARLRDLDQPSRVRRVLRTDDEHQIAALGERADRVLAVLGRVADVLGRRPDGGREPLAQRARRPPRSRRPRAWSASDRRRARDRETCSRATSSAEVITLVRSGASPTVPSTSSWPSWPTSTMSKPPAANRRASAWTLATSGQVASITFSCRALGVAPDLGRDAVGGEDHGRARRHLVDLVDEHRAAAAQRVDDMRVVDDLLAHVDRAPRTARAPARRSRPPVGRPRTTPAARRARAHGRRASTPTLRAATRPGAASGRRRRCRSRCVTRVAQFPAGGVEHDPQDVQRPRAGARRQPRRLHVDGRGAALRQRVAGAGP